MQSVGQLLRLGTRMLTDEGIEGAARDARLIMASTLGITPDRLTLHIPDEITEESEVFFLSGILARQSRQPVSQIIGGRWFYGRWFHVTREVLDPRPETESLIEAALAGPVTEVLDLGVGTGAILLTLLAERPEATGVGTDVSRPALGVAQWNARDLGLADRCTFVESDWFAAVGGQYDLIVSNPPYITEAEMAGLAADVRDWEPHQALTPGGDGLEPYRVIAAQSADHLRSGGRVIVEFGATQGGAVRDIFLESGYLDTQIIRDLNGHDRVLVARKS